MQPVITNEASLQSNTVDLNLGNRMFDESLVLFTVNSEIFARILFSLIALKDIFATLKIRDMCMIYLYP